MEIALIRGTQQITIAQFVGMMHQPKMKQNEHMMKIMATTSLKVSVLQMEIVIIIQPKSKGANYAN